MRKNKCSSCGKNYKPHIKLDKEDNRPIFDITKNPILQLAYYRCIQQKIKLRHIYPTDSDKIKDLKTGWNILTLMEVAKTIIDRIPMNYTSKDAKQQYAIYCKQMREREND